MRYLATLPQEPTARKFGDYLLTLGIHHELEQADSGWDLWIKDEDDLERAQRELIEFNRNPDEPRYKQAARSAGQLRATAEKAAKKRRKNFIDVRTHWARRSAPAGFPITIALLALSILATLGTNMGKRPTGPLINALRISPIDNTNITSQEDYEHALNFISAWPLIKRGHFADLLHIRWVGLREVRHGQVWRLITPAFLHFGIFHILFDLWWLYDLGRTVEAVKGSAKFLGIVLLIALLSNLGQFLWDGPNFGGMSGVVYGLFGYMWIKGRLNPQEGLELPSIIIWFMLGWLVACMSGFFGDIANGAHLIGLLTGIALAAVPYAWKKLRRGRA